MKMNFTDEESAHWEYLVAKLPKAGLIEAMQDWSPDGTKCENTEAEMRACLDAYWPEDYSFTFPLYRKIKALAKKYGCYIPKGRVAEALEAEKYEAEQCGDLRKTVVRTSGPAKITTEVCKQALAAVFGGGNWKRTSKRTDGQDTIREFTDGSGKYCVITTNGDTVITVVASDAVLAGTGTNLAKVPKGKYLFSIFGDPMEEGPNIAIVKRAYWDKEGRLDDRGMEFGGEFGKVLDSMGLSEDCESLFSFDRPMSKHEARALMLQHGFEEDPEFTEAMRDNED